MTGTKVVCVLVSHFLAWLQGKERRMGLMAKYRKPKVCPMSLLFIPEDE